MAGLATPKPRRLPHSFGPVHRRILVSSLSSRSVCATRPDILSFIVSNSRAPLAEMPNVRDISAPDFIKAYSSHLKRAGE
jgi:hypothetical protein